MSFFWRVYLILTGKCLILAFVNVEFQLQYSNRYPALADRRHARERRSGLREEVARHDHRGGEGDEVLALHLAAVRGTHAVQSVNVYLCLF